MISHGLGMSPFPSLPLPFLHEQLHHLGHSVIVSVVYIYRRLYHLEYVSPLPTN